MIVVCPKCSTKNRIPDPPDTTKVYRCGKCKTELFTTSTAKESSVEHTISHKERINSLVHIIVLSALAASDPIDKAWSKATGEKPMSWLSNWIVRSELLFFFLHFVDSHAYAIAGPKVRDHMIDEIVPASIRGLIKSSFDGSHVKQGYDVKAWERRAMTETIEHFNDSTDRYASCKKWYSETPGDLVHKDTVVGIMAVIINETAFDNHLIAEKSNWILRQLVCIAALEVLAKSGLKQQVEEICKYILSG